ncbi:hypothetical protein WN55_09054 [Dufourea novaeangliae]|uniref:Uncharacterized protein n=1 Tax=Dufourea novaeangliae TaxID=178035 RepID=A0A154P818_DUFNO|nr:hypothetical protein WN55_09054 [Dufourea novaeangliae]
MRSCLLWLLLFFATTAFIEINRVMGVNNLKHEQNVGTVLFDKSDAGKQCWTTEEFIMLNSRRMFQDLLPKVKTLNYEDDRYIALLMDYFHICLESVRKLAIGKTKHLMLKALADTMGGYLEVYILPLTRHSYYAGNIKYRNARKLIELHEELKIFLRSNGAGWLKPSKEKTQSKIPSIVITPPRSGAACEGLITYGASANNNNREIHHSAFKKSKRHASKHKSSKHQKRDKLTKRDNSVTIPLPFLDDDTEPNSIALPFKKNSLQSLHTEQSAFVLVKYYIASVKCIESKSNSGTQLKTFNQELFNWLQQSVQHHLDDEKWYPGFGGVLRVITTLEESGVGTGLTTWRKSGAYQTMPKIGGQPTVESEDALSPLYKDGDAGFTLGTTELISIAVVSALLVWLLVGLSLVCYRFLTKHSDECSPCEPQQPPVAVLYENKEYCQNDMCTPQAPRQYIVNKFREYWKKKFSKCRGSLNDPFTDEERCLAAISYTSKDTVDVSNSSRSYQKQKFTKSVSATYSSFRKERVPIRNVYYSSDGSLTTTHTESPGKRR